MNEPIGAKQTKKKEMEWNSEEEKKSNSYCEKLPTIMNECGSEKEVFRLPTVNKFSTEAAISWKGFPNTSFKNR